MLIGYQCYSFVYPLVCYVPKILLDGIPISCRSSTFHTVDKKQNQKIVFRDFLWATSELIYPTRTKRNISDKIKFPFWESFVSIVTLISLHNFTDESRAINYDR